MNKTLTKGRDWSMILYPESAPNNWRDIIDDTHLKWIESPLHDKDLDADGNIKKPHWHLLLSFDGPVTDKPVKDIIKKINATIPQRVMSSKGLVRYMIHFDNKEKHQYPIEDIVGHNGVDVGSYFELSKNNKLSIMKEMIIYIYEHKVTNYADFLLTCIETSDDWFSLSVNSNTLAINRAIYAMYQKEKRLNEEE